MELRRSGLLDEFPNESLDRVTNLVARTLGVPIALISLVDADRLLFKSRVGLEATQAPRDTSFCSHVVYGRQPLLVQNAMADPRFAGNPLVTSSPHARAYLGVPLFAGGNQPIGTLCAIDTQPRKFRADELDILIDFSRIIQEAFLSRKLIAEAQHALQDEQLQSGIFRDAFDQAAAGIVHASLSGRLVRINRRAREMLGYSPEEARDLSFLDITHPDDLSRNTELFLQLAKGGLPTYRLENRFLCRDGHFVWTSLSVAVRRSGSADPEFAICVIEDISAQKQAEQEAASARELLARHFASQTERLRERTAAMQEQIGKLLEVEEKHRQTERRLQAITDHIPAMIGYWNRDLHCEFANDAYRQWFGLSPEAMIGMHLGDLLGETLFLQNLPHAKAALAGEAQRFQRRVLKADGTPTHTEGQYLPDRDETGAVRGFYVLVTDISELTAAKGELEISNAKLLKESTTDFLTLLANRRVFSERSEAASTALKESGKAYGLILLDLDDFKQINDHFGHDTGDDVLRAVGRILRDQLRDREDFAARLGGEEFAVMCFGDFTDDSLRAVAARIQSQINKETVNTTDGAVHFTASFGIALSHADDANWKSIFARADAALYEAKKSGKNRINFGQPIAKAATGRFNSLRLVPNPSPR